MIHSLYIKIHNDTGLKYLGQTIKNPFKYKGSGIRWLNHIKVHGNNVTTEIVGTYNTLDEVSKVGIFWSKYLDIVKSKEWANLKEESGNGGMYGYTASEQTKSKMSLAKKGKPCPWNSKRIHHQQGIPRTDDQKLKQSLSMVGRPSWNKGLKLTDAHKAALRKPKSDSSKMGGYRPHSGRKPRQAAS